MKYSLQRLIVRMVYSRWVQASLMSSRGMFGYDDAKWLRLESKPKMNGKPKLPPFRTVDLFAGCGGLSLGIAEFCRRTKREHVVEFASDMDEKILEIYKANFHPIESTSEDIDTLINGSIRSSKLTKKEAREKYLHFFKKVS